MREALETKMKAPAQTRARGRPREFNRETALHAAMLVFWQHGYEGASLTDLTGAMGVSRPTLYATFGDKLGLFREAVDAYAALKADGVRAALAQPTARRVTETLLGLTANERTLPGCLLVQGALVSSTDSDSVREELASIRRQDTALLTERFTRAREEGDLLPHVDPAGLARYVICLAYGMVVESAGGVAPAELRRVVEVAMANWTVSP